MISAQNRSTVQCGQAVAKGGCAQRPFLTIQPARLPPNLHWLKKQNKTLLLPPNSRTHRGSQLHVAAGPTSSAGQSRPAVPAPLCHGCIPLLPLRLRSPFPTAFPLLSGHTVLPGLEDLASTPLSPRRLQEVSQTAPGLTVPSSL